MARPFTIKLGVETIELDRERGSEVVFTVSNASGRPINARGRITVTDPAQKGWFMLLDQPERKLKVDETTQYKVRIAVPKDAKAGSYKLQFDVVEVDNEESFTEGSPVGFQVKGAGPVPVKKFPWWIVIAAGVLVLVGGGFGVWMLVKGGGSGTMEKLVGMQLDEALDWIKDEKLSVKLVAERTDPKEAGQVRRQDPKEGEKISAGETIVSLVYEPPFVKDYPNLKGKKAVEATAKLHDLGLVVTVTQQSKDPSKAGTVVSQDPEADSKESKRLQEGDTVKLVAEKGAIEMPNVMFLPVMEAKKKLEDLNLTKVSVKPAALFPAAMDSNVGKIGFQNQPEGTPLTEDTPIELIPIGAAVLVPHVKTGIQYADAAKTIEGAKLKAGATAETPTDEEKAKGLTNTVKRTMPGAGERALEGSTVYVVVVGGGTIKFNPRVLQDIELQKAPILRSRVPIKQQ